MLLGKDIPDESVDLVLTDPPFGIDFNYSNGYTDDPDTYLDLLRWTISESTRVVKPGGLCFVFVAQLRLRDVLPLFPENSRIFAACKSWVQIRPTAVQYAYDPVIFWQKGKRIWSGRDWHVAAPAHVDKNSLNKVDFHSCPRPLDTIIYMVENWSDVDGVVLDWFMGSGTTALAAKLLNRHWIGFEMKEETSSLANERVAKAPFPLRYPKAEQIELAL